MHCFHISHKEEIVLEYLKSKQGSSIQFFFNKNHSITIVMSSSSHADPGPRVAFKRLNFLISVTALAAWLETFKCLNV